MGVPKRRRSKQRNRIRRAVNLKLNAPELVHCPQCRAFTIPHRICPACGYYKAKPVIAVEKN